MISKNNDKMQAVQKFIGGINIEVTDQETQHFVEGKIKEAKTRIKALDDGRFFITRKMDESKQAVMDLFNKPKAIYQNFVTNASGNVKTYILDEQAKAKAIQDALDRKAREDEAERQRILNEEAAKKALENKPEEAKQILEQKESINTKVFVPTVKSNVSHSKGSGMRDYWKWEVTNLLQVPEEYFVKVIDTEKVAAKVKSQKDKASIPGIRIYNDPQLVS